MSHVGSDHRDYYLAGMKVSILLFYNQDRGWLADARKSAYQQHFSGYEIIEQHADQSTSKNINDGLRRCQGEYIKLLCDDDLLPTNCLYDLYKHARKTGADVTYACATNFNGETAYDFIPEQFTTIQQLATNNQIHGGTVLYLRAALVTVGGFDESLWTGEEWELHMRMAKAGMSFSYLPKVVHMYRMHSRQKSQSWIQTDGEYVIRRYKEKARIRAKYQDDRTEIRFV